MLAVAVAGLAISVIGGFLKTLRALNRMEMRLELVWEWYLEHHGEARIGGKRRTDPKPI